MIKSAIIILAIISFSFCQALAGNATVRIDSNTRHQRITGFGGFVNGPQFQQHWMTEEQIKQLWGANSEMGYNIMRIYIPVGENNFAQALPTAILAQSMGLKIFASPWSMPAQWKTNNSVNGYVMVDGVQQIGYLREEFYEEYAHYLDSFVTLMRANGVELAAISIQNEPDFLASYAGCLWTPEQMARFIRDYGHLISAPIMAPESVGITDNYVNAFLPPEVFNNFDIFGGHQYGPIQTAHKQLQQRGMEVWMTEYLINWNSNTPHRNVTWQQDAFPFARAVNDALLADVNAWIHYASRRFYAMMGDGLHGTQNGVITKRGYILSHYARYTTGTTRVSSSFTDVANLVEGSAFLSVTGDSIIIKVINPATTAYTLTVDLPFLTNWGYTITTTETQNMVGTPLEVGLETFRPRVTIAPSSFTTLIFRKSSTRPPSEMVAQQVILNPIENQVVTNPAFGTAYRLSDATVVFDNARALISNNRNIANGFLRLDDRYNKIVFNINSISSPASFNSANTTLVYVDRNEVVREHNYGEISFNPHGQSQWVLDISEVVLPNGISGIIGIRNGNWTSILTITFGDVYFLVADEKAYSFSGPYSKGDSNLLDALENVNTTTIDFTSTTGITPDLNWQSHAANKNAIFYIPTNVNNNNPNVIRGGNSQQLILSDAGGGFNVPTSFTANSASYTLTVEGFAVMVLPFEAIKPAGVQVYLLNHTSTHVTGTSITGSFVPANTPVLVVGTGRFTFAGSGMVSTPKALTVNNFNAVYIPVKAPANSYTLRTVNGITSFHRVALGAEPTIMPFSAYLDTRGVATALTLPLLLDGVLSSITPPLPDNATRQGNNIIYDLLGRPVDKPREGAVYIKNGEKFIFRR